MMQRVRRMVVVTALVAGMVATAAPAHAADSGCRIMGPQYVEGVVDCAKYILTMTIIDPDPA